MDTPTMDSHPTVVADKRLTGQSHDEPVDLLDIATILVARKRLLTLVPLGLGLLALGIAFLIPPTFTAQTIFLPPQQQQSGAVAALASLGPLAGLAGGAGGIKTTGDQYVSLLQSANVEDRIIDRFKLMEVYESKFRESARKELEQNVRIQLGKKDGLITIQVDANSPALSADIANDYVAQLRRLTNDFALSEAQQRRMFFEREMQATRTKLNSAQQALQLSGFNAGALKAEPKAAAEAFARAKSELTAAEVKLQVLRRSLADSTSEVQQQLTLISSLRQQLSTVEATVGADAKDADYVSRYREFKYQEALFEAYSKQYEMARVDESKDGAPIQVVDPAVAPERKSKPRRGAIAVAATIAAFLLMLIYVFSQHYLQQIRRRPENSDKLVRLKRAWKI